MELQCCANIPSINHYRSQHSLAMGTSLQGISQHHSRLSHHLKAAPSPLHKPAKNKQSMAKANTSNQLSGPAGSTKCTTTQYRQLRSASNLQNCGWCFGALLFLRRLMLSGIVSQIVHHAVKFLKCPGLYPWASKPLLGVLPV
ncbi:hypothetical protein Nepgr_006567 [Nepenthes gracilis]|uniref:Uncharacterized protein n=1 Tax=Nepenthes gracilis TaxID=150966 RepID=A0AAD3S612_NEPGR|nr:hypothetical protein Nepgr_006567 [Nepenthes gracilis]